APAPRTPPTVAPTLAAPAVPEKVIGLYIAEHEGTNILGPKIHNALRDRGLRFGARRIYHRFDGEHAVFSVASLVKPGALDPAEAEGFATPGLSVFMQLPGPVRPVAAFQDMLDTARGLARALHAELYDTEQRAPLTPERERTLHEQVEEWARRYTAAGRLGG
ncbi:MAG: cell division protein ZipA C-terminal FtsZ-binding domain-containing protein, partial [Nevskiaceae bacterium]